jgi:glycosyltransferase involved in cell wall biosynthesis
VRAYQWIDRILIRHADHVVAVSAAQKARIERLRVPSGRISVVPNAIDPAYLERSAPVDLRLRFGFDSGDFVCVAGGRFSEEKGQTFLVEAAADALRERYFVLGSSGTCPAVCARRTCW